MNTSALFQPFRIGKLELKNRIVMAPMTRSRSPQGVPGADVAAYYARRAAADVGLILSEGTVIERPVSKNDPGIPDFFGREALAGWRGVVDGVHAAGGRMGPQIWHMGAMASLVEGWQPPQPMESPSGLTAPGKPLGRAMTDSDIADTIAAFAKAAAQARSLGFDVVEIHGAHGYLLDQFFWDATNRRGDRYGGSSLAQRSLFASEVVKAVRHAVGPGFPILLRISQWKSQDYGARLARTPEQLAQWLLPLVEAGVDVLDCSQRRFWEAEYPEIDGAQGLNLAGWAKKLTGAATISVGSVGLSTDFLSSFAGESATPAGLDDLLRRLERKEFDLIAVGRMLLQDAQWASKVREGRFDQIDKFDLSSLASLQ